nr:MAG TPA: hypothetical protein [Caudoviricetes sp.]
MILCAIYILIDTTIIAPFSEQKGQKKGNLFLHN